MAERYVFIGKQKFPLAKAEEKQDLSQKPKRGRPRRTKIEESPSSSDES